MTGGGAGIAIVIVLLLLLLFGGIGVGIWFYTTQDTESTSPNTGPTPREECENIFDGTWNATTQTCGPKISPQQQCAEQGLVWNVTDQRCYTSIQLESICVNDGNIWDAQTEDCITDDQAATRCESTYGNHWYAPTRKCVTCETGEIYFPETGMCARTGPATGDDLIAAEDECIRRGGYWDYNDNKCYDSVDSEAYCHEKNMIRSTTRGEPPHYCVPCESRNPYEGFDPETKTCKILDQEAFNCYEDNLNIGGLYWDSSSRQCIPLNDLRYACIDSGPTGYFKFVTSDYSCVACPGGSITSAGTCSRTSDHSSEWWYIMNYNGYDIEQGFVLTNIGGTRNEFYLKNSTGQFWTGTGFVNTQSSAPVLVLEHVPGAVVGDPNFRIKNKSSGLYLTKVGSSPASYQAYDPTSNDQKFKIEKL